MFYSAMGKSKTGPTADPLFPKHSLGAIVFVTRPHLWAGVVGEVVAQYNDGNHRVKITGKDSATFHTDAMPQCLKHWPWKSAPIAA